MAVATGDLLQIIDFQTYLGEELMNVYYYRYSSTPTLDNAIYEELAEDFQSIIVAGVCPLQNQQVEHVLIEVKNLSNGIDFFSMPVGENGTVPTTIEQCLPSYVTINFRLIRDSLVTRNGSKRISGIQDLAVEGNVYVDEGAATDAFIGALESPLHAGVIEVAFPVIVKRPIDPPVGSGYVYSSVSSALFGGLGTQNTRKPA